MDVAVGESAQRLRADAALRTPRRAGARMVPFAGWEMPVQYEGVIPEHLAVRRTRGVFDVSHMGQLHVEGPTQRRAPPGAALERPRPDRRRRGAVHAADERARRDRRRPDRLPDRARPLPARRQRRQPRGRVRLAQGARERAGRRCATHRTSTRWSPCRGRAALERLGLDDAPAFTHAMGVVAGVEVMVCRTGYTGERASSCCAPAEDAVALWDAVVARGVDPCGLGARDTLRLEVCYPLHGNDITQETDAISAGLGWACALDKEFTGVDVLRRDQGGRPGAQARRVRHGGEGGSAPGHGRSRAAARSPRARTRRSLDVGIGMGYVPAAHAGAGHGARHRRPRQAAARARREEADLPEGGT